MNEWSPRRFCLTVLAACLAAALLCTWPLALHLRTALPLGTESAATVPLFDVWTLWWHSDRLPHGYAGFWNAPIFHPASGAFAFSEPSLLPGLLAAPFFWLHAAPALGPNLVRLLLLAANGALVCRLARAWALPRLPAILAGVVGVTLPFVAKVQGELPIVSLAGTLLALDAAVRFGHDGRARHAAGIGAGLFLQALLGQQVTLMSVPFVAAAAGVAWAERGFAGAAAARLALAGLLGGLLIYFGLARTPLHILAAAGFQRSAEAVQLLSAHPGDFLSRPLGALAPFPPVEDAGAFTQGLFPGIFVLLLAVLGVVLPNQDQDQNQNQRQRRWRRYLLGAAGASYVLAMGLNLSIAGWQPFTLLRLLPGFHQLRSAFRFALLTQLHLVLLAAFGLAAVIDRAATRGPAWRGGRWPRAQRLVVALGLLAALENLSVPARLLPVPATARTAWTTYLRDQPAGTVVAHVPFPPDGDVDTLALETWRLFFQMDHHHPLVNGYASNFPALHREFFFAMGNAFPQHELGCALRRVFAVDRLVVDQGWLAAHQAGFSAMSSLMTPAYADDAVAIFDLHPADAICPPMRIDLGPAR